MLFYFIIVSMELLKLIKSEFEGFGRLEKVFFPLVIVITVVVSLLINDNKIALLSAICGISYTILAGKGRVICYFIGMIGTICYSYLAFINGFYGNLLLYALFYFPMEIIGIFKWSKNLKKNKREIIKTKLSKKEKYIYLSVFTILAIIASFILKYFNAANPYMDSFTTVFSILGQILTVKRCIEQWYVWFIVNVISMLMWIVAYSDGSNCLATIIMWFVYVILAVYFLIEWEKELLNTKNV